MKKLLSILLLITISARADVGRVWVDSTPTATLLAHELGHGQYKFKHTFSEIPELAEGTTTPKNVEDYAPGSYLYKYQWDQIHFPLQDEFVCLDSDKEGQAVNTQLVFLTPDRKPFKFNLPLKNAGFILVGSTLKNLNKDHNGTINAFSVDGVDYFYDYENKEFKNGGNKYINIQTNNPSKISLLIYYGDCQVARLEKQITNYQSINTQIIGNPRTYDYCKGEKPKIDEDKDCPSKEAKTVKDLVDNFYANAPLKCFNFPIAKRLTFLNEMLTSWFVTECLQSADKSLKPIGNCYEPLVYSLILSTPEAEGKLLLDSLRIKNLIYPLLNKTQFSTFDDIANKLNGWLLKYYPPKKSDIVANILKGENKKYIVFDKNFVSANILNTGIQLIRTGNGVLKKKDYNITIDYYDYVVVYFIEDAGVFKKGQKYTVPAMTALYLFNKDRRDLIIKTSKITVEIGLLAIGAGEIGLAYEAYTAGRAAYAVYIGTKAVMDIGMGLGDMYIQNSLAEDWNKTEEGKKKLAQWNRINTLYAIGTISLSAIDLAYQKFGKSITNNKADDFLTEVEKGIGESVNVLEENGFAIVRGTNNEFVAKAWLDGVELNMTIITKGTTMEGKGREVFRSLFQYINSNFDEILKIRGTWRSSDAVRDNLNSFNSFIKAGLSPNEAAMKTYTGKMADELNFIKANVLPSSIKNTDGTYNSVDVLFTK